MTNSFYGYVLQANVPVNESQLERHLRIIKPEILHVLNNPTYAAYLKRNVVPDTHVFMRHYDADGDGNDWIQYSPQAYFDKYAWETMSGALGLQISNEPGFGRDVTQKLVGFMLEGVKRNIPVAPGGFSVGSPPGTITAWAEHDDFVKIICDHPTLLSYSAHEYFQGLPTSGMVTAQTKPGEQLYFAEHMRAISDWPTSITQLSNMFHVGRVKAFVDYAKSRGYGKPTIDITESGVDDVEGGALKAWAQSLKNGANLRGYKTWEQQWMEWFGLPRAVAYTTMLAWIRNTIYKPLGVRGATIFSWGDSGKAGTSQSWETFDCATDPDFQTELEKLVAAGMPPATQEPPTKPPIPPAGMPPEVADLHLVARLKVNVDTCKSEIIERQKEITALEAQIASILAKYNAAA